MATDSKSPKEKKKKKKEGKKRTFLRLKKRKKETISFAKKCSYYSFMVI